jgi:predicted RNase H-like HicB family nuclease
MTISVQAQFQFFGQIKRKGKWFIAYCPPLDLSTQGKTIEEAKKNLIEASQLFIVSCLERGTLDQALRELGFVPLNEGTKSSPMPPGSFNFPVPIPLAFQRPAECRA